MPFIVWPSKCLKYPSFCTKWFFVMPIESPAAWRAVGRNHYLIRFVDLTVSCEIDKVDQR